MIRPVEVALAGGQAGGSPGLGAPFSLLLRACGHFCSEEETGVHVQADAAGSPQLPLCFLEARGRSPGHCARAYIASLPQGSQPRSAPAAPGLQAGLPASLVPMSSPRRPGRCRHRLPAQPQAVGLPAASCPPRAPAKVGLGSAWPASLRPELGVLSPPRCCPAAAPQGHPRGQSPCPPLPPALGSGRHGW